MPTEHTPPDGSSPLPAAATTESVVILSRSKGSQDKWTPMSIRVNSVDAAKTEIRNRSDVLDNALEFAIRVVTIEEFSERQVRNG